MLDIRDMMVCFRIMRMMPVRCVVNYYSAATIDLTTLLTSVLYCVVCFRHV